MLGRFILEPTAALFTGNLPGPVDRSDFAVNIARAVAPFEPIASFGPFYYADNVVPDGIGGQWTAAGSESSNPFPTAINSVSAVNFVHNGTKRMESSFAKADGSFTIVTVHAVAPEEAATFPSLLFASGPTADTSHVCHARYQDSTLRFFATNVDAQGFINTGIGAGGFALAFSYNAATGKGAVVQANGTVQMADFAPPPFGTPWNIGGWINGFGFSGKVGLALIFPSALHVPSKLAGCVSLLNVLKTGYGI